MRHEAARQISILENGGVVHRETRGFDAATGATTTLRGKEALADYRFAPEPDVPPVFFTDAEVKKLARGVPELPDAARTRLIDPDGAHRLPPDAADAPSDASELSGSIPADAQRVDTETRTGESQDPTPNDAETERAAAGAKQAPEASPKNASATRTPATT